MTATPLPARIVEVTSALTDAQRELEALLDGIPVAHHDAPVATGWTIAQVIEHLARVEDGSGRVVSRQCAAAAGTVESETAPLMPSLAALRIETVATPLTAPEMVQPQDGLSAADALARLREARARLLSVLLANAGRALSGVTHPHPRLGVLNGYQWGLFLALHQRRHQAQIVGIARALAGGGA
jgi:hypothetical protein